MVHVMVDLLAHGVLTGGVMRHVVHRYMHTVVSLDIVGIYLALNHMNIINIGLYSTRILM